MSRLQLTVIVGSLCLCAASAQTPPAYHGPIQVELLKFLSVRHVQNGSAVFVRVIADWNAMGCTLRRGSIVEARVELATPHVKGSKGSQLALSFSKAQCSGAEMAPIDLVLAAVSWMQDDRTTSLTGQYPIVRYGARGGAAGVASSHLSTTGIEFAAFSRFAPRPNLHPGEVYGIRGVTLQIGAGPGRSSLLSAKGKDLSLDKFTQFLLVPESVAFLSTPVSLAVPGSSGATTSSAISMPLLLASTAPAPPEEFEACSPPYCNVDLPATDVQAPGHPTKSIAIHSLGYAPRPQKEIAQLDDDEALAWLGPERLLLAFNPHTLVRRDGTVTVDAPVRTIHAVLLDVAASRVLSTADWQLSDTGKYLWQLSGNRILVHVHDELQVYNAQLQIVSRLPLAGPLAFVRISPDGELIMVAVLQERHTQELHAKLLDTLNRAPEEDVNILILDKEFKTITQATTTSDIMPPTLMNEGQINLLAQPRMRYRLAMNTWDNQTLTLARFSSACRPELSSFAPDLLLVQTCSTTGGSSEFRVLRPDGQVVMRGRPNPQELGHEAKGNNVSQTFAVKVMHAASAVRQGSVFHGSDLVEEEVRVYRATDGKRLAAIRAGAPAPSHDGYSLSPDGAQLAILSGAQISIYPVPTN
jgi:hypothetical protein